jgi:hypothetical protein
MLRLPPFSALKVNYPTKAELNTKQLLDRIGGGVRQALRDDANTCALRVSLCFNRSGAPIVRMPGLYELSGARPPDRYIVRVHDMKTYLERVFGPGRRIYDARSEPSKIHLGGQKHVQGVVVFDWLGPPREFGATGHVDLFRVMERTGAMPLFVPACEGTCYWLDERGPMVADLWETRP